MSPNIPYDRVAIEKIFKDTEKDLTLGDPELWNAENINLVNNCHAEKLDRTRRVVTDTEGNEYPYDVLVFATGSRAVRIPILNSDAAHVFRTIDDVKNMVSEVNRAASPPWAAHPRYRRRWRSAGLEAAEGLKDLGRRAHHSGCGSLAAS